MRRVVITGMGILNSLGQGLPTVWKRMTAGDNGISAITHFDSCQYRCKVAAEARQVDGFGIPERDCYATPPPLATLPNRHVRRGVNIFLACTKEAFQDSGLAESGVQAGSVGVAAGASVAFL